MPYRWVWVNDELDERAEKDNRLTFAEAERRSGFYHRKLRNLVDSGVLRTVLYGGREYIDGQSLAHQIQQQGFGPSIQEQAEELRRTGRAQEAAWLLERAQATANAEQGVYPQETVQRTAEALPDPVADFITRFVNPEG